MKSAVLQPTQDQEGDFRNRNRPKKIIMSQVRNTEYKYEFSILSNVFLLNLYIVQTRK